MFIGSDTSICAESRIETNSWLEVDLQELHEVYAVEIYRFGNKNGNVTILSYSNSWSVRVRVQLTAQTLSHFLYAHRAKIPKFSKSYLLVFRLRVNQLNLKFNH